MAYILGNIWADGSLFAERGREGCLALSLKSLAVDGIVEFIHEELCLIQKLQLHYPKRGNPVHHVRVTNREFCKWLAAEFSIPADKSVSDFYPSVPDEWFGHFLRGYLDGDGCVTVEKGHVRVFFMGTLGFLEGLSRQISRITGVVYKEPIRRKDASVYSC